MKDGRRAGDTSGLRRALGGPVRAIARRTAGLEAWQPFYDRLYRLALQGRNFGEADFSHSGETNVVRLLASRSNRAKPLVVLDVGANVGGWTALVLSILGERAHVHAFEPAPEARAELAARFGDDARVSVVPQGIGAVSESRELYGVAGLSGLTSLHNRDLRHVELEMRPLGAISVTTLDAYCEGVGVEHVDLLKLDVEGNELASLRGAERLLAEGRVDMVQFEFGGTNIDSRTYLRDFFEVLGPDYEISRVLRDGFAPVSYSELHEVFVTVNYLAVRRQARVKVNSPHA